MNDYNKWPDNTIEVFSKQEVTKLFVKFGLAMAQMLQFGGNGRFDTQRSVKSVEFRQAQKDNGPFKNIIVATFTDGNGILFEKFGPDIVSAHWIENCKHEFEGTDSRTGWHTRKCKKCGFGFEWDSSD